MLTGYADGLARNPWIEVILAPLSSVAPVRRGDRWFAKDIDHRLLPMAAQADTGWKLAALSGGHPLLIFGEWDGRSLMPVGVWADSRLVTLAVK